MSPEWNDLATWGSLLWALATLVVLSIQLLAWPEDRQMWAALVTVFATSVFIWRLWIALQFGVAMRDNPSAALYVVTTMAWGWYGYESWKMNVGRYLHRIRNWRQHPAVAWCCDLPVGVVRRARTLRAKFPFRRRSSGPPR